MIDEATSKVREAAQGSERGPLRLSTDSVLMSSDGVYRVHIITGSSHCVRIADDDKVDAGTSSLPIRLIINKVTMVR